MNIAQYQLIEILPDHYPNGRMIFKGKTGFYDFRIAKTISVLDDNQLETISRESFILIYGAISPLNLQSQLLCL